MKSSVQVIYPNEILSEELKKQNLKFAGGAFYIKTRYIGHMKLDPKSLFLVNIRSR
ncbi:hypothetical protein M3175_17140 [Robertmurraya korlensis]|uniref:hypothetical protein n=1 Tax=Robertmurraya korlensis TaxID=519977 RepID=UPI00203E4E84|nr:hypothetical protein [Robertmurraya korlensis]MCM3602461.1 hypothetical protein [Robertmurraya korlensis]